MTAVIILIIIGLANENNLWLYIALALSVLGGFVKYARQLNTDAQSKQIQNDAIATFLTALQAKNN